MKEMKNKPKFPTIIIVLCGAMLCLFIFLFFKNGNYEYLIVSGILILFIITFSIDYFMKRSKFLKKLEKVMNEEYELKLSEFKYEKLPCQYDKIVRPIVEYFTYTLNITEYEFAIGKYDEKIELANFLHKDSSEFKNQKDKYLELKNELLNKINDLDVFTDFFFNIRRSFQNTMVNFLNLFNAQKSLKLKYEFLSDTSYTCLSDSTNTIINLFLFPLVIIVNYNTMEIKVYEYNHINLNTKNSINASNNLKQYEMELSVNDMFIFKNELESELSVKDLMSDYKKGKATIDRLTNNEFYKQLISDNKIEETDIFKSNDYLEMVCFAKNNCTLEEKKIANEKANQQRKIREAERIAEEKEKRFKTLNSSDNQHSDLFKDFGNIKSEISDDDMKMIISTVLGSGNNEEGTITKTYDDIVIDEDEDVSVTPFQVDHGGFKTLNFSINDMMKLKEYSEKDKRKSNNKK